MGFTSFFAELHFARGGLVSIRQQGCRVLVYMSENYSSASVALV